MHDFWAAAHSSNHLHHPHREARPHHWTRWQPSSDANPTLPRLVSTTCLQRRRWRLYRLRVALHAQTMMFLAGHRVP